ERQIFRELFADTYRTKGLEEGIVTLVQAMLQSPQFLYRFEANTATPLPEGGAYALDGYELASRLSYFLWNTMPDAKLWQSAVSGVLTAVEELRAEASRLLDDPRARATVADFTQQWLGLAALSSAVRRVGVDSKSIAVVDSRYSPAWQQSLERFVVDQTLNGGTFADLFSSPRVFVNRELFELYPAGVELSGDVHAFVAVDYPTEQRSGLLTLPALMALLSP